MHTVKATAGLKSHVHMNIHLPTRSPQLKNTEKSDLLELSYEELEELNLALRTKVEAGMDIATEVLESLESATSIKAVTVLFTDLEGKLHGLDYDRKFILDSLDNLTFDGSSIRGFSTLDKSDLRLSIDWNSFRWAPADIFGKGKVIVFASIADQNGDPYSSDYRSVLKACANRLRDERGFKVNVAPEIEGFLLEGLNAEKCFDENTGFRPANDGGYYNALPQDKLRVFMDWLSEATRALGFVNEKDHPEVAPGQFEINFKYRDVLHTADQIQLYKLVARQIASSMGMTASFLPKPIAGINGSGMHSNLSLSQEGRNLFYDPAGQEKLSEIALMFVAGVLYRAKDICLSLNSSVNAYRRLDPNFEAPNAIKMSSTDRGSMIRIPLGNEKSARMEVRTVAPDANPYLAYVLILEAGMEGIESKGQSKAEMEALLISNRAIDTLPGTIQEASSCFEQSEFIKAVMGPINRDKFLELKKAVADRSPKDLGVKVKKWEILDHHEVRNQVLSSEF